MNQDLLKLRNKRKSTKPRFDRVDVNVYPHFRGKWRRQRGIQNKLRRGFKSRGSRPEVGFGSPKKVKGLTRQGLIPVIIKNIKELNNVNKTNSIILSSKLGGKNKIKILSKIKELNLSIHNIKDVDLYIKNLNSKFEARVKELKSKKDKREKTKKIKEENKKEEEVKGETAKTENDKSEK